MMPIVAVVAAYLLGSIPFGYLLVKVMTGSDVRSSGSGNIGATNVLRTTGRLPAILTLLLDIGKGYLAVWLAGLLTANDLLWTSASAVAVVFGHAFPVFLKFKGGKAVASFIGAFLRLTPIPLLAVLIVFVVTVAVTRYISLGSILAAGMFPFAVWLILHPPLVMVIAAAICGALVVFRHRANISRLRAGSENVFSFRGAKR